MSWVLIDPKGIVQGASLTNRAFLEPREGEEWTEANGWRIVWTDGPVYLLRPFDEAQPTGADR